MSDIATGKVPKFNRLELVVFGVSSTKMFISFTHIPSRH